MFSSANSEFFCQFSLPRRENMCNLNRDERIYTECDMSLRHEANVSFRYVHVKSHIKQSLFFTARTRLENFPGVPN